MIDGTVVPKAQPLTEEGFHNRLLSDFVRLERKWGAAGLALRLGLSGRALGNIKSGATLHPQPHRLFNLLVEDPDALSDTLADYGLRAVPKDATCTNDLGTLLLAALLHRVAEFEHPDSEGGAAITSREARQIDEEDLLKARRLIDRLLDLRKVPSIVRGAA